jgi:hypothetical protein
MPATPTNFTRQYKTKAEAATACLALEGTFVIIQAGGQFYTYRDAKALDADADAFRGHVHVREVVLKERQRRPFVDVDGEVDLDPIVRDLLAEFGGSQVITFRTQRGAHLITRDAPLISIGEHARGLVALKASHPAVDAQVLHSLRLPGTRKPGGPVKEWPAGVDLSDLLCQPFDAPPADESGPTMAALFEGEPEGDADGFAKAASAALCGAEGGFKARPGCVGACVVLDRQAPALCRICNAVHEHENAYAVRVGPTTGAAYCLRNRREFITFSCGALPIEGPGAFNPTTADEYEAAPLHEGGPGCQAGSGDYLDASPCGIGKSKAAWESLDEGETTLCVSYRRSFTAKTAADHGLTLLPASGTIKFTRGCGLRAVVQLESLHRVEVEDGALDTIMLDEWHGIQRHGFGDMASVKSRNATARLEALVLSARRVIVLDAYAHDADRAMFEQLTGRPFSFVRNTYKPDTGKEVVRHASHAALFRQLQTWIKTRRPGEKCAVFSHLRDKGPHCVEELTRTLQRAGLAVKYYHSGTCQITRAADFSDVARAFGGVDCVVYNASLEAGVSIELPEFTRLFCFSSRMGAVEVVAQALHRFRCVTRIDYAGKSLRPVSFAPQSVAGVHAAYQRSMRGRSTLLPFDLNTQNAPGANATALDSFAGRAWVQVVLEGFRSARHFDERLMAMLADSGYAIRVDGEPVVAPVVVETAGAVDEFLASTPAERVANAFELLPDELDRLTENTAPKNAGELAAIDRALFCSRFEVQPENLTAEVVEAFAGKVSSWLRYRDLLTGTPPAQEPPMKARASSAEVLRRVSELTGALGFGRVDAIGVADLAPVSGEAYATAVGASAEAIRAIHGDWGYLFGSDIRKPAMKQVTTRAVAGMLKSVLGHMCGLELATTNQKDAARGVYILTPAAWPAERLKDVPQTIAAHRASLRPVDRDVVADLAEEILAGVYE